MDQRTTVFRQKGGLFLLPLWIAILLLLTGISAAAEAETLPAPAGIRAEQTAEKTYRVSWEPVEGAKKYRIQYLLTFDMQWYDYGETESPYFDFTEPYEDWYYVRAAASDGQSGYGPNSDTVFFAADEICSNLSVSYSAAMGAMENSVTIQYTKYRKDRVFFELYRQEGNGEYRLIQTMKAGEKEGVLYARYTDTDLKPETVYRYAVRRLSTAPSGTYPEYEIYNLLSDFRSMLSAPAEITTPAFRTAPLTRATLEKYTGYMDEESDLYWMHLTWDAVPGADGYYVFYSRSDIAAETFWDVYASGAEYTPVTEEEWWYANQMIQTGFNVFVWPYSEAEGRSGFAPGAVYHFPNLFRLPSGRIELPSGVIRIEAEAFAGIGDTAVRIPNSVRFIDPSAFSRSTVIICDNGSYAAQQHASLGLIRWIP